MTRKFIYLGTLALLGLIWAMPSQAHQNTVVIKMTANGFEPREVTVDTETIINFANKDTAPRWPASNVHPSHAIYPALDPTQPIPPGDFWIFKPTQAGTWKIHDHLAPHQRGTITVNAEESGTTSSNDQPTGWVYRFTDWLSRIWAAILGPFRSDSSAQVQGTTTNVDEFLKLSEDDQYASLKAHSEANDLSATWKFVKTAFTDEAGGALGGRSHDSAHYVGQLLYEDQGIDGLAVCDTTFAFGCYHGFTETAFDASLELLPGVVSACGKLGPINSGPWSSCIHGIGHGVATFYDSVELDNALAECDTLSAGANFCHDGVFMQFSFTAPPNFYKSDDPLFPCSDLSDKYQHSCGRNQPNIMRGRLNITSPAAIAAVCATGSDQLISACVDSIGFTLAGQLPDNPSGIVDGCRAFTNPDQHAQCVAAAAGELVFQDYANWRSLAPATCQLLDPPFQAQCTDRWQRTAQNYQR